MDTTEDINTVEWFFGYGGNHLGLKRVLPNLRLLAACEIEEFAVENILAKMEAGLLEAAPIWSDCKTFPWEPFVDRTHLFVASYPCQPFSAAGKRQGTEDERHLWPYVYRWILRARPLFVFLENVEGHVSLGLSTVISDLEEGGYKATWGIFSASEVGAPHQRKRVFILAYDQRQRIEELGRQIAVGSQQHSAWDDGGMGNASSAGHSRPACSGSECAQGQSLGHTAESNGGVWPSRPGEQQFWWEPPRVIQSLADAECNGLGGQPEARLHGRRPSSKCDQTSQGEVDRALGHDADRCCLGNPNSPRPQERPRQRGAAIQGADADGGAAAERQTQSPLGRDADGSADWLDDAELYTTCDNRTDELRLLGNGVVPASAERAFRTLVSELVGYSESQ